MEHDLGLWLTTGAERTLAASVADADGVYARVSYALDLMRNAREAGLLRPGEVTLLAQGPSGEPVATPVRQSFVVGRGASCDLSVDDSKLSRTHFRIEGVHPDWRLDDLESRNGTRVNGRAVKSRLLCDGDIIEAGGQVWVFVAA